MIDNQWYSCRSVNLSGVRCRNRAALNADRCHTHRDDTSTPAVPAQVMVKATISEALANEFTDLGLNDFDQTPEREAELREERILEAKELARSAFTAVRGHELRRMPENRTPDSGTQVFGKFGLPNTGVTRLLKDLKDAGYHISSATHVLRRIEGKPPVLALIFKKEGREIEKAGMKAQLVLAKVLAHFTEHSWTAHVWSNPEGKPHTANLIAHSPKPPKSSLRFARASWDAEKLAL